MSHFKRILFASILAMLFVSILISVTNNRIVTFLGTFFIIFFSVLITGSVTKRKIKRN
ncbi:hypothetical protein NCCP2222_21290 [Sporosarcina sp. NCCP-2222]|nr:hypothetical protein NCCP2222_21290 [Sporosarcina sp. NCCP-2222]